MTAAGPVSELIYHVTCAWLPLAEPPPQNEPLSEADLSRIWQGQRFPPEALTTADGRAVEVVHPGRRGGGAGPDFRDAVVRLDGVERRGDIELHVRASAFRGHGHDADPAYGNLALHVVYRADEPETRLPGGALAPVAAFAPWLEGRSQELASWLQAPEIWREPCRGAVERLGEASVRAELEAAGLRRFRAKAERLTRLSQQIGSEEAIWRALLDTLGVGGDRDGFQRLAEAFPAALALDLDDPEAALIYVAGLGPETREAALPAPLRPPLQSHGRPANRPQRRLAGLAVILGRARGQTGRTLSQMALASVADTKDAKALLAQWQAPPGIGPGRAQELLVNAVLPFAASQGLETRAAGLLRGLPAPPSYGKTAFLEANLRPAKGRISRNVLQSQGMLGYVAEWCSQGGCGRCPLSLKPGVPRSPTKES